MKICKVEGCNSEMHARGVCSKHYSKAARMIRGIHKCGIDGCTNKVVHSDGRCTKHHYQIKEGKQCSVEGCHCAHYAKGMCLTHYNKERYAQAKRRKELAMFISNSLESTRINLNKDIENYKLRVKSKQIEINNAKLLDQIIQENITETIHPVLNSSVREIKDVKVEHRGIFKKMFSKLFGRQ